MSKGTSSWHRPKNWRAPTPELAFCRYPPQQVLFNTDGALARFSFVSCKVLEWGSCGSLFGVVRWPCASLCGRRWYCRFFPRARLGALPLHGTMGAGACRLSWSLSTSARMSFGSSLCPYLCVPSVDDCELWLLHVWSRSVGTLLDESNLGLKVYIFWRERGELNKTLTAPSPLANILLFLWMWRLPWGYSNRLGIPTGEILTKGRLQDDAWAPRNAPMIPAVVVRVQMLSVVLMRSSVFPFHAEETRSCGCFKRTGRFALRGWQPCCSTVHATLCKNMLSIDLGLWIFWQQPQVQCL